MKPLSYAILLAVSYAVVGGIYILISSLLVEQSVATVDEASDVELIKGLVYVFVTATLFLGFSFVLFRRLANAAREVARAREAFVAAERRATLGLFAAAIGHDFNNVLMIFQLGLAELSRGTPSSDTLATMNAAVEKAEGLIRRLSVFDMTAQEEFTVADARKEVGDALALLRRHQRARRAVITLEAPEPVVLGFYPVLLHQIVMNLVMNAVSACPPDGKIVVGLNKSGGKMTLVVEDSGPGLPEVTEAQLFEPFYTTKFDGTGLGLPSVKYCVDIHGGTIEIGTSRFGGALFRIEIPDQASTKRP